jgi:hypothetical protein
MKRQSAAPARIIPFPFRPPGAVTETIHELFNRNERIEAAEISVNHDWGKMLMF